MEDQVPFARLTLPSPDPGDRRAEASDRPDNPGRTPRRLRPYVFTFVVVLLLAACSGGEEGPAGAPVEIEMLPAGIGRGFAEIVPADGGSSVALSKGQPAPGFYLQLEDGSHVSLEALRGRPVMLNFWATWCGPCRAEMPEIVAAAEADDDLVVLAVNVQEEMAAIEPFAADFGMSMPVVRDVEGNVRNAYGVNGMPTSIFIDRDGNVSSIWAGLLNAEKLADLLAEIQ